MSAVSSYSPSVKLLLLQISSWTTERSSTSPRWRWNTTRIGGGRELLLEKNLERMMIHDDSTNMRKLCKMLYIYICSSDRGEHPDQIQYLIIYLLPCFGDPHETFTALWLSLTTNPWRPVMRPFGGLSCFWVNMVNHVLQAWQGTFAICVWEKLFANPSQS